MRLLFVGYALIGLAIGIASTLLLYQSYGYGLGDDGDLKQSGLVFVSSQPKGATIYLNGKTASDKTDARLAVESGTYRLSLGLQGYREWQRSITVNGGDVQRFDYPLLVPTQLKTTKIGSVLSQVTIATQSPDRRWVLLGDGTRQGVFAQYDLKDPQKLTVSEFVLPSTVYTLAGTDHKWEQVEWSTDNAHVLLKHSFTLDGSEQHEYVLVNREKLDDSQNITRALSLTPEEVPTLFDKKVAKFYIYTPSSHSLRLVKADATESITTAANVLAYKTYGSDIVLYATNVYAGKPVADKVHVVLQHGVERTLVRELSVSDGSYLLDLARYDGNWYTAISSSTEHGVYIYKNPEVKVANRTTPRAWRFLRVEAPSYMAFSENTRFILAQNGQHVSVYDAETTDIYRYDLSSALDTPQTHAKWMDGHRLVYVSGGKLRMVDYDNVNPQVLEDAASAYLPFVSPDYKYSFTLVGVPDGLQFTATSFVSQ